MKYAFNTWAYSHFPCWVPSYSFEETVNRLAKIGYDGIEIGCAQPQAWPYYLTEQDRKQMRSIVANAGIRISSMLPAPGGGPGGNIASACKAEREWTKQYWKDCIDLGLEIDDCKTLLCVCGWYIYGTRERDAWKWAMEGISEVADYAKTSGVTLMLEPTATDSNLVESCDDAINMMEDVGKENVKLMFDTTHALYRNEVPADYVYQMGKNLKHIACYEGCGMVTDQEGVCCIQNPAAGREERLGIGTIGKTDHPKKVVVVGAGVAGLKAAEIAAKRGHSVVVFEKEAVAGGQLLLAEKIPYRSEHNEVYRYLECELQNLHVPVKFNTEATKELIDQEKPDCVIIATGSHATLPQIPTGEIDMIDPRTAMRNPERIGSRAVMIDRIGYWQAMGVADYVSEMGAEVSIVTKQLFVGVDIVETCRENLNRRLARKGVKSYTSMSLKRIEGKTVVLQNIFNGEECQIKDVDTLIVAQESLSDNSLYYALKADGRYETHVVGDAAAPGTVLRIVFEAETMARRI